MNSNPTDPKQVIVVTGGGHAAPGSCPVCLNGSWTGTYSCCAWLLAIICFPVGILCCLCMRRKKCTKCGYTIVVPTTFACTRGRSNTCFFCVYIRTPKKKEYSQGEYYVRDKDIEK